MTDNEVFCWISNIAKRIASQTSIDYREFISVGYLGYASALQNFDAARGAVFKTFAEHRVVGSMRDYIREQTPGKRWVGGGQRPVVISLDEILDHTDHDHPLKPVAEKELSHFETPTVELGLEHLGDVVSSLTEREQALVYEYYWNDKTMKEVGEDFGLTESRISQIHTKVLKKLKKRIVERRVVMKGRKLSREEVNKRVEIIKTSSSVTEAAKKIGIRMEGMYSLQRYPAIKEALTALKTRRRSDKPVDTTIKPTTTMTEVSKTLSFSGTINFFGKSFAVNISIKAE